MDTVNSPEEMMQIVKQIASQCIGKTVTSDLKRDLATDLIKVLENQMVTMGFQIETGAIKLEKDPEDGYSLIPANLYTLLLMMSIFVDYEEVKDKTEYTMSNGTVIMFEAHKSRQIIKPVKPIEYIKINFTIDSKKINLN
jgi:hypothetical protein